MSLKEKAAALRLSDEPQVRREHMCALVGVSGLHQVECAGGGMSASALLQVVMSEGWMGWRRGVCA